MTNLDSIQIRFLLGDMFTLDMHSNPINRYPVKQEAELFNDLILKRQKIFDGIHPNGKDYNTILWDNFEACISFIAEHTEYRNPHHIELLAHKFFLPAIDSLQQMNDDYLTEPADKKAIQDYIESLSPEEIYICNNPLQIAYAMELHHLRKLNKRGHGEAFRKCENCGRYFITETAKEKYCSVECQEEAKSEQMKDIHEADKNKLLKRIRDRYKARINSAGDNTSLKKKREEEYNKFKEEREQKKSTLTESQYIKWLTTKDKETRKR